jgi:hypothetical protein
MKLLILGHGEHGKDTAAEIISQTLKLSFMSSSEYAAGIIFEALNVALDGKYNDVNDAYDDRRSHRELWRVLINLLSVNDRSALTKRILMVSDIYVGMRCKETYESSKHLFDHVIWVDALKRLPPDETMTIPYNNKTMTRIDNNGSIAYMDFQINQLANKLSELKKFPGYLKAN